MPAQPTPRIGLAAIDGGDAANTIDSTNQAQMQMLDGRVALFAHGSLATRPVSTPASPGLGGRVYYATDTGTLYYDYGTGWVQISTGGQVPLVTAMPSDPFDSQEVYYQSPALASAGLIWHFRYRAAAAGAYKWEFLGGGSLHTMNDAVAYIPAATTVYSTPAGAMSLVVPLAGQYDVTLQCSLYGPGGINNAQVSYAVGATPANESWSCAQGFNIASGDMTKTFRHTIAAGATLAERVRHGSAAAANSGFARRRLRAIPVRV